MNLIVVSCYFVWMLGQDSLFLAQHDELNLSLLEGVLRSIKVTICESKSFDISNQSLALGVI